jgi:hypothetical protein
MRPVDDPAERSWCGCFILFLATAALFLIAQSLLRVHV